MNDKMKECFKPHVLMHSLFGLGLGILLAAVFEGLRAAWLGLVLMAVSVVLDMMRKDEKKSVV
jgi:hypothetical protein